MTGVGEHCNCVFASTSEPYDITEWNYGDGDLNGKKGFAMAALRRLL